MEIMKITSAISMRLQPLTHYNKYILMQNVELGMQEFTNVTHL